MEQLSVLLAYAAGSFLAALAAIVLFGLLAGGIRTAGLLRDAENRSSPIRVQLLIFTLLAGAAYLVRLGEGLGTGSPSLPGLPMVVLLLLAGSHVAYLARKAWVSFF